MIEALPLTAVGKVFKPALKRQATVIAVSELLKHHQIEATVSSKDDPTYGFIVLVNLDGDASHQQQVKTVLDQLAIYWQWDE